MSRDYLAKRLAEELGISYTSALRRVRAGSQSAGSIEVVPGKPQEHRPILPPNFDPKNARWFVNVGTDDEPEYVEIEQKP